MRGKGIPREGTSVDKGTRPRKYSKNTEAQWGVCDSAGGGLRSCHLHRHMGDPRRVGGHGNPGTRPPLG